MDADEANFIKSVLNVINPKVGCFNTEVLVYVCLHKFRMEQTIGLEVLMQIEIGGSSGCQEWK